MPRAEHRAARAAKHEDASGTLAVPRLPIGRYRLSFRRLDAGHLPQYTGSAWRGAIGHALRRGLCMTGLASCEHCPARDSCLYAYLFETPPPPGTAKLRLYRAAPHPFVLEPGHAAHGAQSELGLTVFGHGNRHVAHLIQAARAAGWRGLGKDRVALELQCVEQESAPGTGRWEPVLAGETWGDTLPVEAASIPPCPGALRIDLSTPLRLRRDGRNVTPESFVPADLLGNLIRRVSLLTYFHTDTPLETDFADLAALAGKLQCRNSALRWQEWARYSTRQRKRVPMGGLLGRLDLDLSGAEALWPYLWLGRWCHAGRGTSMGLGEYGIAGSTGCTAGFQGAG